MQRIDKIVLSCISFLCSLTACSYSNSISAEYLSDTQLTTLCDAIISTAVLDTPSSLLTSSCISKIQGSSRYLAAFDRHDVIANGLYDDSQYVCICSVHFLNDDQDNIVSEYYRVTFTYDWDMQQVTDAEVTDYAEI